MISELFEGYACKFCGNKVAEQFARLEGFGQADGSVFYVCQCKVCGNFFSLTYIKGGA